MCTFLYIQSDEINTKQLGLYNFLHGIRVISLMTSLVLGSSPFPHRAAQGEINLHTGVAPVFDQRSDWFLRLI
jgi:hypothetical protein